MGYLILDIETRPHEKAEEYIRNTQTFKPPANYKDEAKIESWLVEAKKKALSKVGLHPATSRVWVISMTDLTTLDRHTFSSREEWRLMRDWMGCVVKHYPNHKLAGFNSKHFDFNMLVIAAIRNNSGLISQLRKGYNLGDVFDCFSSQFKFKLSDLSWIMDFDDKTMHGSEVAEAWRQYTLGTPGIEDMVREYCEGDVEITTEFFIRYFKDFNPKGQ